MPCVAAPDFGVVMLMTNTARQSALFRSWKGRNLSNYSKSNVSFQQGMF